MNTADRPPLAFHNPTWRIIRGFLTLATVGVSVAVVAGGIAWHAGALDGKPHPEGGAGLAAAVSAMVGLSLGVAMLLSALLTIPNARKADRCFDEFRRHEVLAEWTYGTDEWDRYIEAEGRRLRRAGLVWAALAGGPMLAMAVVIAVAIGPPTSRRMVPFGMIGGLGVVGAVATLGGNRWYIAAKRRRLRANPYAVVSSHAVYCGGDFAFWGSHMLVLRSARVVEGPPAVIEVVVGTGGAGQAMAVAADVALMAVGRVGGVSNQSWRYAVLIPDGRRAEADAAVRAIAGPPPATAAARPAAAASPAPSAAAPPPCPAAPPPPPATGAARWWGITAALFAVGLGLMVMGVRHDGGAKTTAELTMAGVGFLLWCLMPVSAVVAVVLLVRGRRRPTTGSFPDPKSARF